jgi:uncharacterized protein YdaU (DUF1376 family)
MHWYKRDPDAALAGMAELNFEQRGAYNSLLDLLYSRDGDVPDDDFKVARMMGAHWRSWAALKLQLIACGKVWSEGGKLTAKRVQETLIEASELSQEQSRRASKGWQKRKKNNENKETVMPPGNASTSTSTTTSTLKEENLNLGKGKKAKNGTQLMNSVQPSVVTNGTFIAKPDSPEFAAWVNYYKSSNKFFFNYLTETLAPTASFTFESQWPPGYQPNGKAAP